MKHLIILSVLLLAGCSTFLRPVARVGDSKAIAPRDNGTPAVVDSGKNVTRVPIPANTRMVVVEEQAMPATETESAKPATTTLKFDFSEPTSFERASTNVVASTGAIDTTVAKHRIDVEGRKVLLYAAIAATALAIGLFVAKWPTPALASGVGAVVFFLSYQLAGLPQWFWMVGAAVILAGIAIMLGYKRAEWDANGDLIPDFLQKKAKQ